MSTPNQPESEERYSVTILTVRATAPIRFVPASLIALRLAEDVEKRLTDFCQQLATDLGHAYGGDLDEQFRIEVGTY